MRILWQDFLRKRAFPLFKSCTDFFLDWLVEDGKGHLVTNPSTSPEHYFIGPDGQQASVSYGSTMDMAILHHLFSALISAAKVSKIFSTDPKKGITDIVTLQIDLISI